MRILRIAFKILILYLLLRDLRLPKSPSVF